MGSAAQRVVEQTRLPVFLLPVRDWSSLRLLAMTLSDHICANVSLVSVGARPRPSMRYYSHRNMTFVLDEWPPRLLYLE